MSRNTKSLVFFAAFVIRAAAFGQSISLTTLGSPYSQAFNSLANSGTSSAVPFGWAFSESGTNANTTYSAGTGSSITGDTYSFGASSSMERAFGGLQSGSLIPTIGSSFINNTGATITSLLIEYTGEQWRLGTIGRVDRMDFQLSTNATSLTTGTYTDYDNLDFSSPVTTGTVGVLDGNSGANRTSIAFTISGLSIANGSTFFVRWTDFNASGSDDGLAIDDFTLTPYSPSLAIDDVDVTEGNSGTTIATFTVRLSIPAGPGGVTFDIATQDNTALTSDNDYGNRSLTAQSIAQGSSTFTFDVTINGDNAVEADETYFVNVTNVTGAAVSDGQGLGTITNDDLPATHVRVETAADGSGTVVPPQNITAGSSITVYAIARDASNNFVANVAADSWVLQNITGGVAPGDLVPSGDMKSAVFTGYLLGSAEIRATSGSLAPTNSGTLTVVAGAATNIVATAGTPQSAQVNTAFAMNLQATVTDASTNPVGGVLVTFTAPSSGASGTFAGGVNTATTDVNGVATASAFTANNIVGGPYDVSATVPDVTSSADFALTNTGEPVTITCPENITASTEPDQCSQSVSFTVTTTGTPTPEVECKIGSTVITSPHTFPVGNTTVTCTASNGVGDPVTCTFTVTVQDDQDPTIGCPQNIIVRPTSLEGAVVDYVTPTGSDNCSAPTTQIAGLARGSRFPIGTTINTFEAADPSGNVATCSFSVTVSDPGCAPNKVYVCHKGKTICINVISISDHLGHGDVLGSCSLDKSGGEVAELPQHFGLEQNFPNPCNPTTTISYALPVDANVTLAVYNVLGQRVALLVYETMNAGYHDVTFDASHLASGMYFTGCRQTAERANLSRC